MSYDEKIHKVQNQINKLSKELKNIVHQREEKQKELIERVNELKHKWLETQ